MISRYDIDSTMQPSKDGNYVDYEDHISAMRQAMKLFKKATCIMESLICSKDCICSRCIAAKDWIDDFPNTKEQEINP